MRLLELKSSGECSLTRDLIENIPPYAILSHTWGGDNEEVTFHDFMQDVGKSKTGYRKIRFCEEQAARDGIVVSGSGKDVLALPCSPGLGESSIAE